MNRVGRHLYTSGQGTPISEKACPLTDDIKKTTPMIIYVDIDDKNIYADRFFEEFEERA